MELIKVNIGEFKNLIYPYYKRLFPRNERKSYFMIKYGYNKGITSIIKITDNLKFVGFMIVNSLPNNEYLQLDYFAILPEYQNKGYGTKAIKLLAYENKDYFGIFIEIEKIGMGKNNIENNLRLRREKFYKRLNFYNLNYDLNLFKVIYTPYVFQICNKKIKDEIILQRVFEIYKALLGEKIINKNCNIIKIEKG